MKKQLLTGIKILLATGLQLLGVLGNLAGLILLNSCNLLLLLDLLVLGCDLCNQLVGLLLLVFDLEA